MTVAFCLFLDYLRNSDRPVRPINIDWARRTKWSALSALWRIASWPIQAVAYSLENPAIVYITISQSFEGFCRDCFFLWFFSLQGRPIVAHLHGGNYRAFYESQRPVVRSLVRRTLARVQRIVVLSDSLKSMFDFAPEFQSKIVTVFNGSPSFAPYGFSGKELPKSPVSPVRLLFLSSMSEPKGFPIVLEVAKQLLDDGFLIEAHFAGEFVATLDASVLTSPTAARDFFFDFRERHSLTESVFYHGSVSGSEKSRLLMDAHFFLLPTAYASEGQPISVIEAMSAGCVAIAPSFRGLADLIEDGATGHLVERDAVAIAEAIKKDIRNPTNFARMSHAAVKRFGEQFSSEAYGLALESVLKSCQ